MLALDEDKLAARRLKLMSWIAKAHDIAICIWAAKFLFSGQTAPAVVLFGWFTFIWLLRITGLLSWIDWYLPEGWMIVLATLFYTLALEAFLIWAYWEHIAEWVVEHY
jgi:hypothetical protein